MLYNPVGMRYNCQVLIFIDMERALKGKCSISYIKAHFRLSMRYIIFSLLKPTLISYFLLTIVCQYAATAINILSIIKMAEFLLNWPLSILSLCNDAVRTLTTYCIASNFLIWNFFDFLCNSEFCTIAHCQKIATIAISKYYCHECPLYNIFLSFSQCIPLHYRRVDILSLC